MVIALFYSVGMDAKVFYCDDFVLSNTCGLPFVTINADLAHSLRKLYPWKIYGAAGLITLEYSKPNGNRSSLAQIDYISSSTL